MLGYVRVCSFVNQERQAAWGRGDEVSELRGRRRVAEDGQLSGRREGRRLVEDEADAGVYAWSRQMGSGKRRVLPRNGATGGERDRETRTSVDEWPGTDVHGTPEAASLCKVPPVPIPIAKHVLPRLLIAVQSIVSAGRARVRWHNELVDCVAFC